MKKHQAPSEVKQEVLLSEDTFEDTDAKAPMLSVRDGDDSATVRELLEKNLKWSQIIYEQNRKINRKLLWAAIADWLRLSVLIVPFIFAILYLPPIVRNFEERYSQWLQAAGTPRNASNIQDLLNLLPLSNDQREQVKAMMH